MSVRTFFSLLRQRVLDLRHVVLAPVGISRASVEEPIPAAKSIQLASVTDAPLEAAILLQDLVAASVPHMHDLDANVNEDADALSDKTVG